VFEIPILSFGLVLERGSCNFERSIEQSYIERGRRLFAACLFLPPSGWLPNLDKQTTELSVLRWIVGFDKCPNDRCRLALFLPALS
jgi:hypothetical protein